MSENEDEPGWVALTGEWPVNVLVGLLEAVTARLKTVGECMVCDHCFLAFPPLAITKSFVHFAGDVDRDTDSVLGQAAVTNICSQCYRIAQKEAAMQRLAPLLEGMRASVTLGSFDLDGFLRKEEATEDDRQMPGQYL